MQILIATIATNVRSGDSESCNVIVAIKLPITMMAIRDNTDTTIRYIPTAPTPYLLTNAVATNGAMAAPRMEATL